jgi:hypothetical protein
VSGSEGYFRKLQAAGFERKDNYGTVTYSKSMHLSGSQYRVQAEQKKNDEIIQINYRFEHIEK